MDRNIWERYKKQKLINEEGLKKVNSFIIFIEQKIKSGKFVYSKTGYTIIDKKIEEFDKDADSISVEGIQEIQEILDIFENMFGSFDKKENSIEEAYCLSHIIIISHKFFKKGYKQLLKHINRLSILYSKEDIKYDWIEKAKEIIKIIENNYKVENKKDNIIENQIENKIEKFERDMNNLTKEEILELLDFCIVKVDSFDKDENSISEGYYLAKIILINYKFLKADFNKIWPYINRLKIILLKIENEKYDWIKEIKKAIEEIEIYNIDNED